MRPIDVDIIHDYMVHAANLLTIDPSDELKKQVEELESER